MQTMWLPQEVCDEIDKCTRAFIWGGSKDGHGIHLVRWNKVTKPRAFDGLDVRQARLRNTSFLGTLVRKVINSPDNLSI